MAYDRFAYTNNNPMRYTDPSGHTLCGGNWYAQQHAMHCSDFDKEFNITFKTVGNTIWTKIDKLAVRQAVWDVSKAFGKELKTGTQTAWLNTYEYMTFQMGGCDNCTGEHHAGYAADNHRIEFAGLSDYTGIEGGIKRRNLVVHELGHVFRKNVLDRVGVDAYSELAIWRNSHPGYPDRESFSGESGETGPNYGFASRQNVIMWQQSLEGKDGEEFADQFLGWTYDTWETNASGNMTPQGKARSDMMNSNMPLWVNLADNH